MEKEINIEDIKIVFKGQSFPALNTFKSFLEKIKELSNLKDKEFYKYIILYFNYPISNRDDYIIVLKQCKKSKIMIIELSERQGKEIKDYTYQQIIESTLKEQNISIKSTKEEIKNSFIYVDTKLNEFYAKTIITQYFTNSSKEPIELEISFPIRNEIQFSKFTIKINGKIMISKIYEKQKAQEKYSDAIASGNNVIIAEYQNNEYKINIGIIKPNCTIELQTQFLQFILSKDMSYCFNTMINFPYFNDNRFKYENYCNSEQYFCNIKGKILLKTNSKITRLISYNIKNEFYKEKFNEDYTNCEIEYTLYDLNLNYNQNFSTIIFRTEKINEPYLISQYNTLKNETCFLMTLMYNKNKIPNSKIPDTDSNINYYMKYYGDKINEQPSLFIFLVDQSSSMKGYPNKLLIDSLLFFLQSLPKNSYFQIIIFGTNYEKLNEKPMEYNKENVNKTKEKIKKLNAELGGTEISNPLENILTSNDYDKIKLSRNIIILTDGEVRNPEKCFELIELYNQYFIINSIGLGNKFNKYLIKKSAELGNGNYFFVKDISQINSVLIELLNHCLKNYIYDMKINPINLKIKYDFLSKKIFCYCDEIINYYFIVNGNYQNKDIEINFEYKNENEKILKNFKFTNENTLKLTEGKIISQIIIGNILKDKNNNIKEDLEIKLSKEYEILSTKTALYIEIQNDKINNFANLKKIKIKQKNKINRKIIKYNKIEIDEGEEGINEGEDEEKCAVEEKNIIKEKCKNISIKNEENDKKEKNNFNLKDLVLTQDILDGNWKLNTQTQFLIEKENELYEKISKILKSKNIINKGIYISFLVLYYLKKNSSIDVKEYRFIINKGIKFLNSSGINYEEIEKLIR